MIRRALAVALVLAAGCKLDSDAKTACNSPADCIDGYACVDRVCVSATGPDGPNGPQYGTVAPIASASSGLYAFNYRAVVGTTAAAGNLGCAILRDEHASPGTMTALAYAKIPRGESGGDGRCPPGNHPLRYDAENCLTGFGEVGDSCAVYKAWDASGTQIANRLATGGYVSLTDTRISDMQHTCSVELSMAFTGGVTIAKAFTFTYNPFAPDEAFCTH